MADLTQSEIQTLFVYRDNGLWYKSMKINRKMNRRIGMVNPTYGLLIFAYNNTSYQVGRMVWIYHNGPIPPNTTVDYLDDNCGNLDINNLVLVNTSEKGALSRYPKGKLGIRNITKNKSNTYQVKIVKSGVKYGGCYPSLIDAIAVRDKLRLELYGPEVADRIAQL
jgi:hypothetical protein